MRVPIADRLPIPFRWYGKAFDNLQFWLIDHHVCMRHQEHKIFYTSFRNFHPDRQPESFIPESPYPVMAASLVGVPGWVFPRVAIIDAYGLNDYVIARHSVPQAQKRTMAHDRTPPEGYIESFQPNVVMAGPRQPIIKERDQELTAERIIALEQYWIDKVVNGIDTQLP